MLGLIIAGDKVAPRRASVVFAVGAILGIDFATGIGLWIAHLSGAEVTTRHHSWPGFVVRVFIAGALLSLGIYKAVKALRGNPIADVSEPDHRPGKLRSALTRRFPKLMRGIDPATDLSASGRVVRAGLAGFAVCGLHPKIFPIAIAAGHQIVQIANPASRAAAIAIFAAISVVPAVLPAVIEMINPGAVVGIKQSYERIMAVHGRWITAVLLLGAGAFVAHEAWRALPIR